ncbi:hypothetical protein ACHAQA_005444 [Verticillium albo-atrum]
MLYCFVAGLMALQVGAKTIPINVASIPLSFLPDRVQADVGDVLEFHFYPQNHSVVQGDYHHPCSPVDEGGFFSGFVPDDVFKVTVRHTDPMFFYCSQGKHCASGMVGVVNPTVDQTLSKYARNAVGRPSFSPSPIGAFGGEFGSPSSENDTTVEGGDDASPSESASGGGGDEDDGNFASALKASVAGFAGSIGLALLMV